MSLVINNNMMAANTARTLNGHYGRLAQSTQRLSTGLRVNSAADDAAGLAIRELQRAEIAALHQGSRNANDAISLIQTADGALGIIDEKLIRMKELAEQAATGTYDSTQRLMIASEFVAMGSEINRIANATDFNGIKLLDGSLQGAHDGSGLVSKGALKVHFGSSNSSMEDYYYIGINDSTLVGLGLATPVIEKQFPPDKLTQLKKNQEYAFDSGIIPALTIPQGVTNVKITINCVTQDDDIQLFTRDGYHILGTKIEQNAGDTDFTWKVNGVFTDADASKILQEESGFDPQATYKMPGTPTIVPGFTDLDGAFINGDGILVPIDYQNFDGTLSTIETSAPNQNSITGWVERQMGGERMNFTYSTDGDRIDSDPNDGYTERNTIKSHETVVIDKVTEDLLLNVSGHGLFYLTASWDGEEDLDPPPVLVDSIPHSIQTQEAAQQML